MRENGKREDRGTKGRKDVRRRKYARKYEKMGKEKTGEEKGENM